jgi:hypothetical protein
MCTTTHGQNYFEGHLKTGTPARTAAKGVPQARQQRQRHDHKGTSSTEAECQEQEHKLQRNTKPLGPHRRRKLRELQKTSAKSAGRRLTPTQLATTPCKARATLQAGKRPILRQCQPDRPPPNRLVLQGRLFKKTGPSISAAGAKPAQRVTRVRALSAKSWRCMPRHTSRLRHASKCFAHTSNMAPWRTLRPNYVISTFRITRSHPRASHKTTTATTSTTTRRTTASGTTKQ